MKLNKIVGQSIFLLCSGSLSAAGNLYPEIFIDVDDLEKLEFLISNSNLTIDETFITSLKNGTIMIDDSGKLRVNKSKYDLLIDFKMIDINGTKSSTICAKTY